MGNKGSTLKPKDIKELSHESNFTEQEIKDVHKNFIKQYPSGKVNKTEFQQIYSHYFPQGDAAPLADEVFRVVDVDNSGTVDFREFFVVLGTLMRGDNKQKLRLAFDVYDKDNNGYITHAEFNSLFKSLYKAKNAKFGTYAHAVQDVAFDRLDENGDNRISLDEFTRRVESDPTIMDLLKI